MSLAAPRRVLDYGLASGNAGPVKLLGLCPLLAVSHSAVNALGLGLATLLALTLSSAGVASLRRLAGADVRIPVFVLVIGAVVTCIELAMRALLPALHAELGLFVPLIASNCALMARAEAQASRQHPGRAALDGFTAGLGFLGVLLLLGLLRESLGAGTVFAGAGALLGLPGLETAIPGIKGLPLALLPAGGFVALASLVALRQAWLARSAP